MSPDAESGPTRTPASPSPTARLASLTFAAVPPNRADAVRIPAGYRQRVLIRWGDPVLPGAPEFDLDRQTAEAQRQQFGYNNDFVTVVALDDHDRRALLVVDHEYTNEELMFRGYDKQAPDRVAAPGRARRARAECGGARAGR